MATLLGEEEEMLFFFFPYKRILDLDKKLCCVCDAQSLSPPALFRNSPTPLIVYYVRAHNDKARSWRI